MSATAPLLSGTIEADDDAGVSPSQVPLGRIGDSGTPTARSSEPVVLVPGARPADVEEGGIASSHPAALACLFLFRSAAITVYVLCGLFTDNYVLSIVVVVVLLSLDFWNTRNVAGRTLVGLRYWNEVREDGESAWVFESRDPANPIDSKMFWMAIYAFPVGWAALFIVSLLKFNFSFLPIVLLALVFNISNLVGFTYADRDAQRQWASAGASFLGSSGFGGIGGQLAAGAIKNSVGRFFG